MCIQYYTVDTSRVTVMQKRGENRAFSAHTGKKQNGGSEAIISTRKKEKKKKRNNLSKSLITFGNCKSLFIVPAIQIK